MAFLLVAPGYLLIKQHFWVRQDDMKVKVLKNLSKCCSKWDNKTTANSGRHNVLLAKSKDLFSFRVFGFFVFC